MSSVDNSKEDPLINDDPRFDAEIIVIQQSGILGQRGYLLKLFNYIAQRSHEINAPKESELAVEVFDKKDFTGISDDSSVRVYIYRLRKKLTEFYEKNHKDKKVRLTLPIGEYRLVLEELNSPIEIDKHTTIDNIESQKNKKLSQPVIIGITLLLLVNVLLWFVLFTEQNKTIPPSEVLNTIWLQLHESARPTTIIVGDYFLYKEKNTDDGTERLIRDFLLNSPMDLEKAKRDSPLMLENAEDIGLQYLPLSVGHALKDIIPLIQRPDHIINLIQASKADIDILKHHNIIYIGLVSGLGLLQPMVFAESPYAFISFDEIIDTRSNDIFISGEMEALASGEIYNDYGYISVRKNVVDDLTTIIIAGTRDTGLRGVAEAVSRSSLPTELQSAAQQSARYEAIFEVKGQNQTNMTEKIISVYQPEPE